MFDFFAHEFLNRLYKGFDPKVLSEATGDLGSEEGDDQIKLTCCKPSIEVKLLSIVVEQWEKKDQTEGIISTPINKQLKLNKTSLKGFSD